MAGDVLIVEDDEEVRESLFDVLSMEGYRVRCASHGGEALEQLSRGPAPSLILLDLMMPVMDGWEFLRQRARLGQGEAVPVLVLTALNNATVPAATAVLRKPVKIDELLACVRSHAGAPV